MKQVKLTNAKVVNFWQAKDSREPKEFIKVIPPKEGSEFNSIIVSFQVETQVSDNPARRARLFERCTIYAKNDVKVKESRELIKPGAILEIEGWEDRRPSGKDDGKFYANLVCTKITPITDSPEETMPKAPDLGDPADEDLPF